MGLFDWFKKRKAPPAAAPAPWPGPDPRPTGALPAQEQLAFGHEVEGERRVHWVSIEHELTRDALEARLAEVPGLTLPPEEEPPSFDLSPGAGPDALRLFTEHHAALMRAIEAHDRERGEPGDDLLAPPPGGPRRMWLVNGEGRELEVVYRSEGATLTVIFTLGEPGYRFEWEDGFCFELPGDPPRVHRWSLREG
ncbi:MAG: hypothetical protein P1V51_01325 [Deltaproteobacteria bacterium]|nr:hypothetical protein [Deltaproteobacteria bacterium]